MIKFGSMSAQHPATQRLGVKSVKFSDWHLTLLQAVKDQLRGKVYIPMTGKMVKWPKKVAIIGLTQTSHKQCWGMARTTNKPWKDCFLNGFLQVSAHLSCTSGRLIHAMNPSCEIDESKARLFWHTRR